MGHNGGVRRTGRAITAVLATTLATMGFVADVGAPTPAVGAELPEIAGCGADGGTALGATGSGVACIQYYLSLVGVYRGELTSVFDQFTADAVARYQIGNPPLSVNGQAGVQTLSTMGIYSGTDLPVPAPPCLADADVKQGDTGRSAECVQRRLAELGLYAGEIDGVFGRTTVAALKVFQLDTPPLEANGIAGPGTLAALDIWSGLSTGDSAPDSQEPTKPGAPGLWPSPRLNEPLFNLTPEGIPFYGQRQACTRAEADVIAAQFANDGADVPIQQWAVYIASREGNCNYQAVNLNLATRDDSHCTFQLNALSGMFEPHGELGRRGWTVENVKASLKNCADAASDLWVYCGKGPWTPPYRCLPPWKGDLGAGGDA